MTSSSERRGILVKNFSGEDIPPFACVMLWEGDPEKEADHRHGKFALKAYKPGKYEWGADDNWRFVFNGAGTIRKGDFGFVTNEYPAQALRETRDDLDYDDNAKLYRQERTQLGPKAGSWALIRGNLFEFLGNAVEPKKGDGAAARVYVLPAKKMTPLSFRSYWHLYRPGKDEKGNSEQQLGLKEATEPLLCATEAGKPDIGYYASWPTKIQPVGSEKAKQNDPSQDALKSAHGDNLLFFKAPGTYSYELDIQAFVRFTPKDPNQYFYNGNWWPFYDSINYNNLPSGSLYFYRAKKEDYTENTIKSLYLPPQPYNNWFWGYWGYWDYWWWGWNWNGGYAQYYQTTLWMRYQTKGKFVAKRGDGFQLSLSHSKYSDFVYDNFWVELETSVAQIDVEKIG